MKKNLVFLLVSFLCVLSGPILAQEGDYISYKVNGLEFHLTDVILEYFPDAYYLHIEGIKSFRADLGPDHFPRYKNCESGITMECSQEGDSFIGTHESNSPNTMPVYVSWCLVRQKEDGRKEMENFQASLDSEDESLLFSITFEEFGPSGSLVKGTFHGTLMDGEGKLNEIVDGKFQVTRKDVE